MKVSLFLELDGLAHHKNIAAYIVAQSLASDEPLVARTLGRGWFFANPAAVASKEEGGDENADVEEDSSSSPSDEEC